MNQTSLPTTLILEQTHVQIYRDDAGLNSGTPYAGEDQIATVAQGERLRVRLQIYCGLNDFNTPVSFSLQHRVSTDGGQTWSGWQHTTASTSPVRIVASPHFAHHAATTQRLQTPYERAVFQAGAGVEQATTTPLQTLQSSVSEQDFTEHEWSLILFGANVGDYLQFRAVAHVNQQGDLTSLSSYSLLTGYAVYASAIVVASTAEESGGETVFFEQYTQAGWGFEKSNERAGRWVRAQQRFNLLRRLPVPNIEQMPYGGFRGTEVPIGYRAGRYTEQTLTLECELTLDTISKLLVSFLGAPATTGTGPYTHTFLDTSGANPDYAFQSRAGRHTTIWQVYHDLASGTPATPPVKLIGYGGFVVETLRLRGEKGARGSILTVEATGPFLTAIEAADDGSGNAILTAAPYGSELPVTVDDVQLTLRDTSGNIPDLSQEVQRFDLTLARTVFVQNRFDGKYIPVGYHFRTPRVTGLELEVYRTSNAPVRLIWGEPSTNEPFTPTLSESNRKYAPTGNAALRLVFQSQTNAAHQMVIEIPHLMFASLQERNVGGALYDTFVVAPIYEGNARGNLRLLRIVNAQSATALVPADASITQVGTSLTGVYSAY